MSVLEKISTLGERMDLELHQGASLLTVRHTLLKSDQTPVDLTGAVARGQIRKTAISATVVLSFRTAIAANPLLGYYEFWLTDEDTATLTCGAKLTDADSLYEYDIEVETSDGNVRCTFYGAVRVKAGATR